MVATYDGIDEDTWKNELYAQAEWNQRHMLSLLALFGVPKSMLDVGCGDGTMVNVARALGVEAYGVDQLAVPYETAYMFHHNLVDRFILPRRVDLVISIEVAEHIHESAHSTLCDTLCENVLPGGKLIFSAAHPGQDGIGHLAERPSQYWHNEFAMRGLNYNREKTVALSLLWSNIGSPLYWLPANVQVWDK